MADNGTSLAINRYDESGIPSPANMGRFGYTGQTWLAGIGLWHYKARMYSPTLGRFMQTDPIGYGDGMNMYGYVGGDPVNAVDPTGLSANIVGSNCRASPSLFLARFNDLNGNGKRERGEPLTRIIDRLDFASICIPGANDNEIVVEATPSGRDADGGGADFARWWVTTQTEALQSACRGAVGAFIESGGDPVSALGEAAMLGLGATAGIWLRDRLNDRMKDALDRYGRVRMSGPGGAAARGARMVRWGGRLGLVGTAAAATAGVYYYEDIENFTSNVTNFVCGR